MNTVTNVCTRRRFLAGAVSFCLLLSAAALLSARPASKNTVGPKDGAPPVCACCADEGEWYETNERLRDADFVLLEDVRFAPEAKRYQSPADESDLGADYSLTHTRSGRSWQLRFRDERGSTGVVSFRLPLTAVRFGADLRDAPPGGVGPSLYKEWRFGGAAAVSGLFAKGFRGPARFLLILQGRGNHCEDALHYKHWTLQLKSGRASQTFYGSFS